jgi:hypothetical protein
MRRSFGAGARWVAHESQARSARGCQSIASRERPQKQQIFPASRIRVVELRSPPMPNDKRRKGEIHPQTFQRSRSASELSKGRAANRVEDHSGAFTICGSTVS